MLQAEVELVILWAELAYRVIENGLNFSLDLCHELLLVFLLHLDVLQLCPLAH